LCSTPKLRTVRRREGRYLLRTNMNGYDPAALWTFTAQLTEVEQAFKELKTTSRYDRFITSSSIASKRTSVWPSSPIASKSHPSINGSNVLPV